jgi:hypothetical protein
MDDKFVIITNDDDIIECIGTSDSYYEALGKAFENILLEIENDEKDGDSNVTVDSCGETEADTGVMFKFTMHANKNHADLTKTVFVLRNQEAEDQ